MIDTESFNSRPGGGGRAAVALALGAALLVALHSTALAQGRQTGTIRGSVVDAQGLVLPGVTVNVRSAALQGVRSTVTDINGNYQILALPPGDYDVVFELQGFADVNEMATVSLGGDIGVNAAMAPAGVTEVIQVVGVVPTPIETTVASSNITADEVNALPTSRQPWRIAELQPGLTDNTPNAGQVTINGAFAYDNIFLMDGVDINDNLFGTANALYVADAIQETQVLTSGISAEYGRFSGGVINVITKSGGNDFSGSYRLNMYKPSWTAHTPFEDEPREGDLVDNLDHEITFGGPALRDRLWFFYSGLFTAQESSDTFNDTGINFNRTSDEKRNQFKLTGTIASGHTLSGSYMRRAFTRESPSFSWSLTPSSITAGRRPQDLFVSTYRGALTDDVFAEVQYSQKRHGFRDSGGTSTDIFDSPMITRALARGHYNAPYWDATDPEDRNNRQITGNVTWFLSSAAAGSHSLKAGFERYTSTNIGGNSQSSTGYDFRTDYALDANGDPLVDADQQLTPVFTPFGAPGAPTLLVNWVATRGARIDINTTSFFVNDEWALNEHFSFNLGVRGETVDSEATGGITTVDTSSVVPRLAVAYDPRGDGRFTIQSTYGHYAGKYSETQFAETTNVGNPDVMWGIYTGPPGQGRDYAPGFDPANYFTVGGSFATQNVMLDPGLKSPLTKEFTVSAGSTLGDRGHFKGTYIRRRAGNFIEDFIDTTTGATDIIRDGRSFGLFDNELFRNTDLLQRNYDALQFDGRYSVTSRFQIDGSYTVQIRNEGNFEGEASNQPGIASVAFDYPEIHSADRHYPFGRLNDFQRHKVRIWGIYNLGLGWAGDVDLAGIYRYNSGLSYSLSAGSVPLSAQQEAILAGLPYESPPTSQTLYFDERGTENFKGYGLLDLSVQYQLPIWRTAEPYFKFELLNVFNSDTLIFWNTTVNPDFDGPVDDLGLPLNYIEGPRYGEGTSVGDYPPWRAGLDGGRTYLMALGFRF